MAFGWDADIAGKVIVPGLHAALAVVNGVGSAAEPDVGDDMAANTTRVAIQEHTTPRGHECSPITTSSKSSSTCLSPAAQHT